MKIWPAVFHGESEAKVGLEGLLGYTRPSPLEDWANKAMKT